MDTTRKPVEDDTHVRNAVKQTRTMWRKIARVISFKQTVDKSILLTQDFVLCTKRKKELSRGNTGGMVGIYMTENIYVSVVFIVSIRPLTVNDCATKLAKVSGAPEKTTLGRILPSDSSASSWEWGEIHRCSPNKNTRRIYHSKTNYS